MAVAHFCSLNCPEVLPPCSHKKGEREKEDFNSVPLCLGLSHHKIELSPIGAFAHSCSLSCPARLSQGIAQAGLYCRTFVLLHPVPCLCTFVLWYFSTFVLLSKLPFTPSRHAQCRASGRALALNQFSFSHPPSIRSFLPLQHFSFFS